MNKERLYNDKYYYTEYSNKINLMLVTFSL